MITEIRSPNKKNGKVFALLVDVTKEKEGSFPVTDPSWSLQMLMMRRSKGHVVRKHMHKKVLKSSRQPMEGLVVLKGVVEARIFDRKGRLIAKKRVLPLQCLLIVDGAHEVVVKKDALLYAFKDGPHREDKIVL